MSRTGELQTFLEDWRLRRAFSGAAYAVGNSKSVIEASTVGTLCWDGPPVMADTLWDLASVTKPIVALGLMSLVDTGVVRLDDTISYFLSEYRGTDKTDITVRQLLTHTSGIPGQQPLYKQTSSREELLNLVKELPLAFASDTDVEYTSQGFMILGLIVEAVTGQSLDKVLQETVFDVLGMPDTRFNPSVGLAGRTAATEQCPWRGRMVQGQVHDENAVVLGGVAGHAGLFSTVHDLTRLAQAMLRLGHGYPGFLSESTIRLMTTCHTGGLSLARTLGWQGYDKQRSPAGDLFSERSYGHTGFTGTSIWMDPVHDKFVILLTNRVHPSRENEVMARVRPLFHNLSVHVLDKH